MHSPWGIYHLVVDKYIKKDAGFSLAYEVQEGPELGKKFFQYYADPDALPQTEEKQNAIKFARVRLQFLARALGMISPEVLMGKEKQRPRISFDDSLVGLQCIAAVTTRTYDKTGGGKGSSTEILGNNIFHIHDPITATIGKEKAVTEAYTGFKFDKNYWDWQTEDRNKRGGNSLPVIKKPAAEPSSSDDSPF